MNENLHRELNVLSFLPLLFSLKKRRHFFVLTQRELKERQHQAQHVKSKVRDQRQQSARSRRYYDDYQVRMRSKMLKKRTKEELVC